MSHRPEDWLTTVGSLVDAFNATAEGGGQTVWVSTEPHLFMFVKRIAVDGGGDLILYTYE